MWCARCMPASEAKWGRQQPNLSESGAWTPSNGVPFRTARYALKYWTNTVANVNLLYTNFIRCDVLVACPHRKLNGVGSSKPNLRDRGAWTPSRQLASYVYALKYCTNTVANVDILYMNFIRCDVLVMKLNGVGSSVVEPQPKPARMWGVNTIERRSCTHPETTSKLRICS